MHMINPNTAMNSGSVKTGKIADLCGPRTVIYRASLGPREPNNC